MKKKILISIVLCISVIAISVAAVYGIRYYQRENDPNWQIAKILYNAESALKELDDSWEMKSLSQVTPYCYENQEGNTIKYYCCTTTYLSDEPTELTGLHKEALDMVIDIDTLENSEACTVNSVEAILGELDGQTYLCWTLSPVYSCVIEFKTDTVSREDLFRMAESVLLPN